MPAISTPVRGSILFRPCDRTQREFTLSEADFIKMYVEGKVATQDMVYSEAHQNWFHARGYFLFLERGAGVTENGRRSAISSPLASGPITPVSQESLGAFVLSMAQLKVAHSAPEGSEIVSVLCMNLCTRGGGLPGSAEWVSVIREHTNLLKVRLKMEHSRAVEAHPLRALLDMSQEGDLIGREDLVPLLGFEELKRKCVLMGADYLTNAEVDSTLVYGPEGVSVPVYRVRGAAVVSVLKLNERRARLLRETAAPQSQQIATPHFRDQEFDARDRELNRRLAELDGREAYVASAEADLLAKIEQQQVRSAELDHREEALQRREDRLKQSGN